MTKAEQYEINLKMAQLTGWPIIKDNEDMPERGAPHFFDNGDVYDYEEAILLTTTSTRLWVPITNESQCILVRDRLIELGRIRLFVLEWDAYGYWSCRVLDNALNSFQHDLKSPSEAMCAAFTQLEVV